MYANLFNLINARELRDNVLGAFIGLHKNTTFIAVFFGCAGLQAIFVQFGGLFFRSTGLSGYHWGITVGLGALSLPVNILARFIPSFDRQEDFSAFYSKWFYAKMDAKTAAGA